MAALRSFPICPELASLVHSVTLSTDAAAHTVYPGPAPVLGFQLAGRLRVAAPEGWRPLSRAGVTGLLTGPRVFDGAADTRTVLVRLAPWALPALFGFSARAFTDGHLALADVLPQTARPAARWMGEPPAAAAASVQRFLIERLRNAARAPGPIAVEGVRLIVRSGGRLRMRDLASALGWSLRHVQRVFHDAVGVSPKTFGAIVRYQCTERALRQGRPLAEVAVDHGYYDQAHLANDIRRFTGRTPTALR